MNVLSIYSLAEEVYRRDQIARARLRLIDHLGVVAHDDAFRRARADRCAGQRVELTPVGAA